MVRPLLLLAVVAFMQLGRPGPCLSQDTLLIPNARIRVRPLTRPTNRLTGSFIAVADDSLSFVVRGDVHRLAVTDIKTLQVSTGKKSHVVGTLVGGVTGALAGAWLGASIDQALTDHCTEYCGWTGGLIGFITGGIGGLFAGYHWLAHERWENVPIESLRVSVGPGLVQLAIGL